MARFSEGFLRGISNFGRMDPTEPARRLQQATPSVYQQMGTTDPLARRVGSLFSNLGVDTSYMQTAPERIAAETKRLDMSKPMDAAQAMLIRAQYIQDPQVQAAMVMKAQEIMQAEQQRSLEAAKQAANVSLQQKVRASLIERANALGLEGVSKTLAAGGDIVEPQKAIREAEIKAREKEPDLTEYRRIISNQYDIPEEELKGLTEDQINKVAEGKYATPKPYLTKDGAVRMLSTLDKSGKVWSSDLGKYVRPSELELSPAAQVSKVIQSVDTAVDRGVFSEELARKMAGTYSEALAEADDAALTYQKNLETDKLVDNMFTGRLADIKLSIGRFAEAIGIGGEDITEKVANTQQFFAQRGQAVLDNIKLLGAGSAISNSDREFMKDIVGQNIQLTKETIKRILRIERQALSEVVQSTNNRTQQAVKLRLMDEEEAAVFMKEPLVLPESSESTYLQSLYQRAGITP